MIYRGTTPTISFKIDDTSILSDIEDVWITIKTKDEIILNKTYKNSEVDIDILNSIISIHLSEKETLKFPVPFVNIQLKIKFNNGDVNVSPVYKLFVENILNTKLMGE